MECMFAWPLSSVLVEGLLTEAVFKARLTFNYWRKGGYTVGSEDYRWSESPGSISAFG